MLLNGTHLMPDLSGALACPKERLLVLSDPIGDALARQAPQIAAEALKRLASVLRQRRPAKVVWLGDALPRLLAADQLAKRDADEIARMALAHDWHWIAESLPACLPGQGVAELVLGGLTFRQTSHPGSGPGEISAEPWPVAVADGQCWPCFVIDGRRLVIPAFGCRADGTNVLSPRFQALFRRPFTVLMLAGGRILTRPRARLDGAAPVAGTGMGRRMRLFGDE